MTGDGLISVLTCRSGRCDWLRGHSWYTYV